MADSHLLSEKEKNSKEEKEDKDEVLSEKIDEEVAQNDGQSN